MPQSLLLFPVTLLSTFPHRIQAHGLLQRHPSSKSQRCHGPGLSSKRLKIFNALIHLSCNFPVKAHHKGTLQLKLAILIHLQDQDRAANNSQWQVITSPFFIPLINFFWIVWWIFARIDFLNPNFVWKWRLQTITVVSANLLYHRLTSKKTF